MSTMLTRNDSTLTVAFDPTAQESKMEALESSALIGRVSSPEEQAEAVEAQKKLKAVIADVEKSRKLVKEPILEYGRRIDETAKRFVEELKKEELRLMTLCGNYQTFLVKQRMAEEAAQRKHLEELERQKQAELAKTQNPEQMEAVQEKYCNIAAASTPVPKPIAKAEGQTVSWDWEIVVEDKYALARAHPNCVNIEPRVSDIKALLNEGLKVHGVKAEKKIKSGVRLPAQRQAIEVATATV